MKKRDLNLIIATALYSLLFYKQSAGLNFLLFSIAITLMQLILHPNWHNNKKILISAFASIASGFAVFLYGSNLAIIANITSLSLLTAFSLNSKNSVITAGINAIFSYVSAFVYIIIDWVERNQKKKKEKDQNAPKNQVSKVWFFIIPILIFILFFVFYQNSNPIFKDFTKKLNLDFISFTWIAFTFWGFVWLYGYFYFRNINIVNSWENKGNIIIENELPEDKDNFWGRVLNLQNKNLIGLSTLVMLNLLLMIVNILDVQYIWIQKNLPEGLTFAEFIHNGIGTLIISIIMAIVLILVIFKGKINFLEQNKTIKTLAYIWIAQNILMIISNLLKNQMYIEVFGMTYKRIGVYIWLIMALGGLISTIYKIYGTKSNWFLFRANGWIGFSVLVVASLFNWDMMIAKYNLTVSESPDKSYILELSPEVLPYVIDSELYKNANNEEFQPKNDWYNSYTNYYGKTMKDIIDIKTTNFLNKYIESDWRSLTLREINTFRRLKQLNDQGKIKSISINENIDKNGKALSFFSNVNELNLSNLSSGVISSIKNFNKLSKLKIEHCNISTIESLPDNAQLIDLNLNYNNITELSKLSKYPNLQKLSICGNGKLDFNSIPILTKVNEIDISENRIKSLNWISKTPELKRLHASRITVLFDTIPTIDKLEYLDLSNNGISSEHYNMFKKLKSMKNIKELKLSDNKLKNLFILTNESLLGTKLSIFLNQENKNNSAIFNQLTNLDVSNNQLSTLQGLENYIQLTSLNLSNNNNLNDYKTLIELANLIRFDANNTSINNLKYLENNNKLEELNLSSCNITSLIGIDKLINLKKLNLDNNDISDISLLSKLPLLSEINLSHNSNLNYNGLENIKVNTLYITYNQNMPVEKLKKMKTLKNLFIVGIEASELHTIKKELKGINVKAI